MKKQSLVARRQNSALRFYEQDFSLFMQEEEQERNRLEEEYYSDLEEYEQGYSEDIDLIVPDIDTPLCFEEV
jgi:hypothetical protein